jgi:drug/metabolite transporter (DMT)-like permease
MSQAASIAVTMVAALASACAFGIGVALQHRQVQRERGRGSLRLLAQLTRRKQWLAGIGLAIAAYGLQALALAYGPLALVAPIVATDLLFALPLAARWEPRPMRRRDWAGCALVGAGVAIFVVCSPESAGRSDAAPGDWLTAFAIVVLISAAAATAAVVGPRGARASLTAVAVGVIFGLTAAVTLSLTRSLRFGDPVSLLGHWQTWALLALGSAGLLLSASAYRAGALRASLPIMDTVEPVSAVLIGTWIFGERLASSPAGLALQLIAAAGAITGIVVLARSPLAAGAAPQARRARDRREAAPVFSGRLDDAVAGANEPSGPRGTGAECDRRSGRLTMVRR